MSQPPPGNLPSADRPPGTVTPANAQPEPPTLLNRQTALPWAELRQILHPGEMPFLIVGVVIGIVGYISIAVFVVLTIISVATGQGFALGPSENDGFTYLIVQQVSGFLASLFLAPLLIYFVRGLGYAEIRANGVRMSPTQFPEGYKMVVEAALSGGMRKIPDAYVVSGGGTINAYASGHAWRRFIVVYSDLFEVGGAARDPEALRFVIAHEVGHLAAGHTAYWRLLLVTSMRSIPILGEFLSRAQEYSADNFGYRLTGRSGAEGGIKVLSGGKYLNANVDFDEFADRALNERGFWLWATNLATTHPILIWRAQALRDRSKPGSLFLRPKGNPSGIASLPPGSAYGDNYPTPAEAMAFIEKYPPEGEAQFGKVFPTPLPGEEGHESGTTGYGRRMLTARWQYLQQPPQGPGGPGGYPGGPGGYPGPGGSAGPGGVPGGYGGPSFPPPSGQPASGASAGYPQQGYPQSQPSAGYPQQGYPQSQPSAGYPQQGYPQSQPSAGYTEQGYPQSQPSAGYPQQGGYPHSQPSAGYTEQGHPQSQPSAGYPQQGYAQSQPSAEQPAPDPTPTSSWPSQPQSSAEPGPAATEPQQQSSDQWSGGWGSQSTGDQGAADETRLVPRVTEETAGTSQDTPNQVDRSDAGSSWGEPQRASWGEQPTAVQPAVDAWGQAPTGAGDQQEASDQHPSEQQPSGQPSTDPSTDDRSGESGAGESGAGTGDAGEADPWHRDRDPWHRTDGPDQRG